jgi:ubiquinone/menaquinone biosynthesis C-methylase UbiE
MAVTTASHSVRHALFARVQTRLAARADAHGGAEIRKKLLIGLRGRVIEIGAGSGPNFAHYPATVSEVVAVEPDPYLRGRAELAARAAPVSISVVGGMAEALPAEERSFDVAVFTLVLCSVADQATALAEVMRVLRPGGELRFYEHVVALDPALARVQRVLEKTFWPSVAGGCHPARDTASAIELAGFEIEAGQRFPFRPSRLCAPVAPRIMGIARRPFR